MVGMHLLAPQPSLICRRHETRAASWLHRIIGPNRARRYGGLGKAYQSAEHLNQKVRALGLLG